MSRNDSQINKQDQSQPGTHGHTTEFFVDGEPQFTTEHTLTVAQILNLVGLDPATHYLVLSRTAREPSNRTPYFCLPKRDEGLQSALTTNEVVTLSVSVLLSRRNCDWSFQSEVGDIGNYIVEYLLVAAAWIENP